MCVHRHGDPTRSQAIRRSSWTIVPFLIVVRLYLKQPCRSLSSKRKIPSLLRGINGTIRERNHSKFWIDDDVLACTTYSYLFYRRCVKVNNLTLRTKPSLQKSVGWTKYSLLRLHHNVFRICTPSSVLRSNRINWM